MTKNTQTSETLPAGRVSKILQIHTGLNCNLKCKHCYSSSAPGLKQELQFDHLARVVGEAYEAGYNVISLSGGEPFIYPALEELVSYSKSVGYFNSITTNAMLLKTDRAKRIIKQLDLVAVSIDGKEDYHDIIRGQKGAFQKMLEGVAVLKDNIERYGFIHTVMPGGWQLFPWLTQFALDHKAGLLHLHPLEITGRAKESFGELVFTAEDLHKIYIAHYYLKTAFEEELFIQLDLLHRDTMISNPNIIFHQTCNLHDTQEQFSNIFKELIIDEKGDILPISHGCSPFLKIGNIYSGQTLDQMIDRFMEEKLGYYMELCQTTWEQVVNTPDTEFLNWSELLIERSHKVFRQTAN